MNFEFSPEQDELRHQSRRFLADRCDSLAVRRVLDGEQSYDRALWQGLAKLDEILRNIIGERVLSPPTDLRVDKGIPFNAIPTKG